MYVIIQLYIYIWTGMTTGEYRHSLDNFKLLDQALTEAHTQKPGAQCMLQS